MQYVIMTYHTADDNIFETCLKTLRQVSDCKMVVITDNVPAEFRNELTKRYDVEWVLVTPELMDGNRAGCKITESHKYCQGLHDGDEVIIADVDLYYMSDPFAAFEEFPEFDLAVTTRPYRYHFIINGGLYCYRISTNIKRFITFWDTQIPNPTWDLFVQHIKKCKHTNKIPDWCIGQDFLNLIWSERDSILQQYNINIIDIGPKYNWTPAKSSRRFMLQLLEHYNANDCPVLHLKGGAKKAIYSQYIFSDAITHHPVKYRDWGPRLKVRRGMKEKIDVFEGIVQ